MQSLTTRIWIASICLLCIFNSSCKKFLDTYSQNDRFIETAGDLDEILVGDGYYPIMLSSYTIPEMLYSMDDDVQINIPGSLNRVVQETGFHYWQAQPRINSEGQLASTDYFFDLLYKKIAVINTILLNVPLLYQKGQSPRELTRIAGEAHFLRAFYYFILVNAYGKPYKPATASGDYGVPLRIDPVIREQFVSRSTTQQVYNQIIIDLLEAEKELEGANESSTIRPNQNAVRGLLSRVYLFMENYEASLAFANLVIEKNEYKLTDLNHHTEGTNFLKRNSPEILFTMASNPMPSIMGLDIDIPNAHTYKASDDLMNAYSPQDLRLKHFFIRNSRGDMKVAKQRTSFNFEDMVGGIFLVRLSEIYLNKAEALAALERFEEARTTLQEFRKYRFKPSELPPVNSDGSELINTIREERRLELCMETHRWFDLRRYGVNEKYPFSKTIRHRSIVYTANGYIDNGYYELGPYDQDAAAYTIPIANDEIEFNKGLITNEPRPQRPLKH